MTYPAGTPSMWTTRPHEPHSSSTSESHASFSSSVEPKSAACFPRCSDSSQKTHRRHRLCKLSSVSGAMCQDTSRTSGDRSRWTCGGPPPCASTTPTIDRSSPDSHPVSCDRQLRHDEGQDVPPSWLHSIGSPLPKRQRRARVAPPRPGHRAIRCANGGDDGVGEP